MSTRRLWAVYLAATVATIVAPLIAQWAETQLQTLDEDQADDEPPEPTWPPAAAGGFAENDSPGETAPDDDELCAYAAQIVAESDSEAPSAPAGGDGQ